MAINDYFIFDIEPIRVMIWPLRSIIENTPYYHRSTLEKLIANSIISLLYNGKEKLL